MAFRPSYGGPIYGQLFRLCVTVCFIEVSQCYTKFENSRKQEKARQNEQVKFNNI